MIFSGNLQLPETKHLLVVVLMRVWQIYTMPIPFLTPFFFEIPLSPGAMAPLRKICLIFVEMCFAQSN